MAAPKGNQFWKIRSKHGRDKLFSSAELLWDAATEYFQWCDDNPWLKTESSSEQTTNNVSTKSKEVPNARPYTLKGLCIYLDCSSSYFRSFKSQERENAKDFITVIEKIEEVIYTQKFEGAAVGAFNANIIARDLGLSDKSERVNKNEDKTPLTPERIKEIKEALEGDN